MGIVNKDESDTVIFEDLVVISVNGSIANDIGDVDVKTGDK